MNRKFLIAATFVLGTAYSFACGGGGGETPTGTMPTTTASPTPTTTAMPTETATATATETASATASAPPPAPKSLFERLGGKDAIGKVTDDFLAIVKDDKRLNKFFAATLKDKKKSETMRANIIDFLCKTTGGDCDYKGKDMKTVHAKMKIKDADFDAFMEDLNKALDKNGVGQTEKDEVNTALQGMRADIVTVAAKPAASGSAKGGAAPAMSAAPKASK